MSPLCSADRRLSLLHPYLLSVPVGGSGEKGLPDQRRNLPSPSCREAMQCGVRNLSGLGAVGLGTRSSQFSSLLGGWLLGSLGGTSTHSFTLKSVRMNIN